MVLKSLVNELPIAMEYSTKKKNIFIKIQNSSAQTNALNSFLKILENQ